MFLSYNFCIWFHFHHNFWMHTHTHKQKIYSHVYKHVNFLTLYSSLLFLFIYLFLHNSLHFTCVIWSIFTTLALTDPESLPCAHPGLFTSLHEYKQNVTLAHEDVFTHAALKNKIQGFHTGWGKEQHWKNVFKKS